MNADELNQKGADINVLAEQAAHDSRLLEEALLEISSDSKDTVRRYNSFQVVEQIANLKPQLVSDHWDAWVTLLGHERDHQRYMAIHLITALAKAPGENRFERILDQYFALLDDRSIVNAAHVAGLAGGIACAQPHLIPRITYHLMKVNQIHFEPDKKGMVAFYVLESMHQYLHLVEDKQKILQFASSLADSPNARLKKRVEKFLKQWTE
jgi:hypothetical protein